MHKSDIGIWLFIAILVFVGVRISIEAAFILLLAFFWGIVSVVWYFEEQTGVNLMVAIKISRKLIIARKEADHAEAQSKVN